MSTFRRRTAAVLVTVVAAAAGLAAGPSVRVGATTAVPSSEQLAAALPTTWPAGYDAAGVEVTTELVPASGPGRSLCGGSNEATRAVGAGAIGYAAIPFVSGPDDSSLSVRLLSFPDPSSAYAFIWATVVEGLPCRATTLEVPESVARLFVEDRPEVVWNWTLDVTVSLPGIGGADADGVSLERVIDFTAAAGAEASGVNWDITMMEAHGSVVIVTQYSAYCCQVGLDWSSGTSLDDRPRVNDTWALVAEFRPGILQSLGLSG